MGIVRDLITRAIQQKGSQKAVAIELGIEESALSRKIAGETGWRDEDLTALISSMGMEIVPVNHFKDKEKAYKTVLRTLLEDQKDE